MPVRPYMAFNLEDTYFNVLGKKKNWLVPQKDYFC